MQVSFFYQGDENPDFLKLIETRKLVADSLKLGKLWTFYYKLYGYSYKNNKYSEERWTVT